MVTFLQLCPSLSYMYTIAVSLLPFFFVAWIMNSRVRNDENKSKIRPPEAEGAWPVIGHLHLLRRSGLPHKVLGKMADKYGPLFSIRIGVQKALVVSSREMAKECFLSNDKAVASRPRLIAGERVGYGGAFLLLSPYGPYYRSIRKIAALELLSNHRVNMLSYVWKEEINVCMSKLRELWFENQRSTRSDVVLVDLTKSIVELFMSIVIRIIFGKSFSGSEGETLHLRHRLEDFLDAVGSFLIGDAFPSLRWLDLGGQEKALKKTAKEMDDILESLLREHKQKRFLKSTNGGDEDFMDVMLSVLDDFDHFKDSGYDADTINKATCLVMFSGASGTNTVFLIWAISLLLNNRHMMMKAQDELNIHVGKGKQVDESDIPKLVYLQAIVKETLRMYPPGPLATPREFTEDCTIAGYHIEKGTRLIVNVSKIQNDPRIWEDPTEFRPERFLTTHKDVDVRGQNFELIPFGSGRRMCPGLSYGLRLAQLTLARFLHSFEFSTPSDAPVDMTELWAVKLEGKTS